MRTSPSCRTIESVEELDLDNPGRSDRPLHFVALMPSLEILYLYGFSDAGIDELAKLSKLAKLGLCGPTFSDGVLERCARLPHLKILDLSCCEHISEAAQRRFFAEHRSILSSRYEPFPGSP